MKHKAFLVLIVLGFTFGSMALANYVEPTATAPGSNTPDVVKTGPGANVSGTRAVTVIKSKLGIGDGINLPNSSLLTAGSYIGTGCSGISCLVQTGSTGDKGGFMEKLVVLGATGVVGGSAPKNVLVKINDVGSNSSKFDQYVYGAQYEYPLGASKKMAKALEAIVAGRYISKMMVTDTPDTGNTDTSDLSLNLQATSTFKPTTNIGLGDTCDLYAYDLGSAVGDGGGCPKGSYMVWYKQPSFSGTLSATNNNNGVVFAKCRQFNPSASPTNTGHCATGRPAFTHLSQLAKDTSVNPCKFMAARQGATWPSGTPVGATFNGVNVKLKWYDGNTYNSSLDNKTTFTYGCGSGPWRIVATDDYGQYAEETK